MFLKIYQVYFDDEQQKCLGNRFIHYYNNAVSPIFESEVIKHLYESEFYKPSDFFGVTSWRMHEKTELTFELIDEFISKNKAQVYTYGNYAGKFSSLNNPGHYITAVIRRLYAANIFGEQNPGMNWVNVWCNFWIATPQVVEDYMENVFKPTYNFIYNDNECRRILKDGYFENRNVKYPRDTFVFEYLFGLFLFHRRNCYVHTGIPNKTGALVFDGNGKPVCGALQ